MIELIESFVRKALAEDVGRGDLYATIYPTTQQEGYILAKSSGILAGELYVQALLHIVPFDITWNKHDGDAFKSGDVLATFKGDGHTLLKIERTLLNLLHHATGIATLTHAYVEIIKPYGTRLLDTRKTRPNLRQFEKYATVVGGGTNHRMGLDDALMLKDTHLRTIDDLAAYIKVARQKIPFTATIEVEAESIDMAQHAMKCGADIVMCDNMTPQQVSEVVAFRDAHFKGVRLEASGNISLKTVESYAKTGIDAISTGSTIHQAVWPDLSMKIS